MKIKIFKHKHIVAALALFSLTACKKELDLYPYNAIEITQSFKTIADAAAWNNAFYSSFRGRLYGGYMYGQDVQADYLNAGTDFGNRNGSIHRWGGSFLASDDLTTGVWQGYYSSLKNINLAIEKFPGIATTRTTEADSLKRFTGDAYIIRAYYYSELIIRYAKPYDAVSSTSDLGVPLVLTYDMNEKPARATVKQVYDQILSDIAQAKTMLASVSGSQGAPRFNKDVVAALEARVRLYMKDWAGAVAAANSVISSGTYPLITTQPQLQQMWKDDLPKEVIMQVFVSQPNETANTNAIYLGYQPASGKYDPDFIPTQSILDLYQSSDIRKSVYFAALPVMVGGADYPGLFLVNKFPGNPALFTTANTNYMHKPNVFRVAEQYLISAEAAAELGNDANALTTLNNLRMARGLSALSVSGTALKDAIREERTRELAFEGFRLWDLKRWNLGFTRGTPQDLGPILQGSDYNLLTIPASHYQFTWGIPSWDLNTNPNLVQNPGGW